VEVFDFSGDAGLVLAGVKSGDWPGARLASQDRFPGAGHVVSEGADAPHARDNNPSVHGLSSFEVSARQAFPALFAELAWWCLPSITHPTLIGCVFGANFMTSRSFARTIATD